MMKILFLEDDENRIKKARQALIGHDVVWARTAQEAIDAIATQTFDLVSLDHDLGGGEMLDSDQKSGYAVAQVTASLPTECLPSCIVHSFNPVGAQKMMDCLKGCQVVRFLFGTREYWRQIELCAMRCI